MSPTYLQLTAGDIKEEKFNFKTKLYEVSYNANPEGTSVLFLNREWNYMNGFELELHPK